MSVRQIPPNRRSVTGLLPSWKNGKMVSFESALERDYASTLDFDRAVSTFETQPLVIDYSGPDGKARRGYPDFLVHFRPQLHLPPLLVDVKYRKDLFAQWTVLKPRLKAALAFASTRGWNYKIMTEVEIRTTSLKNVRFLLPYARCAPDPMHEELLMNTLRIFQSTSPSDLLKACYSCEWNRAQLIPTLWCLVGRRLIATDFDQLLTMTSAIWYPASTHE
ncbi:MAG: TnsA endonuclease N-terminal domain-containing protein [Vulcanimicrobiaceae bacterium]